MTVHEISESGCMLNVGLMFIQGLIKKLAKGSAS